MRNFNLASLGAGIGLRHGHFKEILETQEKINWFEIILEDFMDQGGKANDLFWEISKKHKIVGHSVCMSIGSTDPLDFQYLKKYKNFLDKINSPWASDHLCFTMIDHTNLNELIPLPFTKECIVHVVERLKQIQDVLEKPFLIENVTRYITLSDREMNEAEFITKILEGANCGLLLDLTNVYLNSTYHDFDPWNFIKSLPLERVAQIHLAGSEANASGEIIDSHDAPVAPEVWNLLEKTLKITGPTSILIERDRNLPELSELLKEANQAQYLIDCLEN